MQEPCCVVRIDIVMFDGCHSPPRLPSLPVLILDWIRLDTQVGRDTALFGCFRANGLDDETHSPRNSTFEWREVVPVRVYYVLVLRVRKVCARW